jgi:hypothetical protein
MTLAEQRKTAIKDLIKCVPIFTVSRGRHVKEHSIAYRLDHFCAV